MNYIIYVAVDTLTLGNSFDTPQMQSTENPRPSSTAYQNEQTTDIYESKYTTKVYKLFILYENTTQVMKYAAYYWFIAKSNNSRIHLSFMCLCHFMSICGIKQHIDYVQNTYKMVNLKDILLVLVSKIAVLMS